MSAYGTLVDATKTIASTGVAVIPFSEYEEIYARYTADESVTDVDCFTPSGYREYSACIPANYTKEEYLKFLNS